ncbi:MAG: hypothetical protein QMC96_12505 [Methanomicrobiales archaeon]|nr:hypothetical protein [Methanomicrobiales archaeon]
MTILARPRADPDIVVAVEVFRKTGVIEGIATSCDLVIEPEVEYASVPAVLGIPQLIPGAESASTKISSFEITAQDVDEITVTVHVDQAPGGGKSNGILFYGGLIGIPAR